MTKRIIDFFFGIGKQLGATFVSLDDLLSQSDFVIVACPLNNETKNLFDKNAFAKMKSTSVFINVSRGGLHISYDFHFLGKIHCKF